MQKQWGVTELMRRPLDSAGGRLGVPAPDSGKHAFSVIGGGLKPQWLNMGGGLGEGGEIPKTGEGI